MSFNIKSFCFYSFDAGSFDVFHFGRKPRIYEYLQRLEREDEEDLLYSLLTVLEV